MSELLSLAAASTCVIAKFAVIDALSRRFLANQFEEVGTVSKLVFYPIKSCRGVEVDSVLCTPSGFVYAGLEDRCFMLCAPDGRFITQRNQPKMALIGTEVTTDAPGVLIVTAPGMEPLRLQVEAGSPRTSVMVRIWGQDQEAEDCGEDAGAWMDKFLGTNGTHVVLSPPSLRKRACVPNLFCKNAFYTKTDVVSFQDGTPVMLTCEESVQDIRSRTSDDITVLNFIPNILAAGCAAWAEDDWVKLRIGSAEMHGMWLDERCKLTTVDPHTGKFREDGEPLKTLHLYRKIRGHLMPILGVNIGVDTDGIISVGDNILAVKGEVA